MMKRYHEAPKSIFKTVQQSTDGDYALVHLFETDPEYFNMFKQSVEDGRDVILDNSIFELGTSFDHDRYAYWIKELKPTWYIVPDVWKNGPATVEMFNAFVSKHPELSGKRIGVAQGNNFVEVAECYRAIEPHCDMVAFNLDFSSRAPVPEKGIPYCLRMSIGRYEILCALYDAGVINRSKPHHLLGCGVPQEIVWYPKSWNWLRSIDTCNPIMLGIKGIRYNNEILGVLEKPKDKMCDLMDLSVEDIDTECVDYNLRAISYFDSYRE